MGLSKAAPANQPHSFLITQLAGTPGYCDPQYMNSFTLSKESDVYSFGVVLFEVLCGRLCYNYSNSMLKLWVNTWKKAYRENKLYEIVFQGLMQPMDSTSLKTFSSIAFQCLHVYSEERPTMAHVVKKLETALEFEHQKPLNKCEDVLKVTSRVLQLQGSLWEELQRSEEPQSALYFDAAELETLFPAIFPKNDASKGGRRQFTASKYEKIHLIDLRRANATEIMLKRVMMPLPDMMAAALAMDESILDADQIKNFIRFCPTKEEMDLLKNYTGDKKMLGQCEQFFLELMKVPRVESKLCVISFKIQFNTEVNISQFTEQLTRIIQIDNNRIKLINIQLQEMSYKEK
ncbi:putative protein kinase RLK-Pelle-LRR-I-1 family [Helianthus debilis subsp. tardiflorus]